MEASLGRTTIAGEAGVVRYELEALTMQHLMEQQYRASMGQRKEAQRVPL